MNINELSKRISAGKIVSYKQARQVLRLLGEQMRLLDDTEKEKTFRSIVRGNLDTTVHYADPARAIGVRGNR